MEGEPGASVTGENLRSPTLPARKAFSKASLLLILLVAGSLRFGAKLQRRRLTVRPVVLASAVAPEVGQARLVIRVALEGFAVNQHRLAAQVHAARTIGGWCIGHE